MSKFKLVEEKLEIYEEWYRPIDDPVRYAEFCVHMGRQSGKTIKLIDSLPADEHVFIVSWNYAMGNEIAHRIGERRPDINLKQIHIVSYSDKEMHDKIQRSIEIHGQMNIYVDNAVLDMVAIQYVKDLNIQYGKNDDKK